MKISKNTSNRIISLDILRILAGLAVVSIHVSDSFVGYKNIFGGITWFIANYINSTARISVPLFVMISGYLIISRYRENNLFAFLTKRFFRLILPFVFWTVFFFFWPYWFFGAKLNLVSSLRDFLNSTNTHLYFLVIILELSLLTPLLSSFFKKSTVQNQKYFLVLTFLFSITVTLINLFFPFSAYKENILTKSLLYIGYYCAGYFLVEKRIFFNKKKLLVGVFAFSAIANGIFNFLTTDLDNSKVSFLWSKGFNQYFFGPFSPFIVLMTVSLFLIFVSTDFAGKLNRFSEKAVIHLSSVIFGIYLIHPIFIDLADKFAGLRIDKILSPLWFFLILKIIIVFFLSYFTVNLLKSIPLTKQLVS
ncbi:acyltransferase family protein [Candidatus Roizmanbacteria bacterium]|nr:acyltransferase family protein [Candidatus Roizmanbacteria bacterium]